MSAHHFYAFALVSAFLVGIILTPADFVFAQTEEVVIRVFEREPPVREQPYLLEIEIETLETTRFGGGTFDLRYDNTQLEVVGCEIQSDFFGACNPELENQILFNALAPAGFEGKATLAVLEFSLVTGAELSLDFDVVDQVINVNGEPIGFTIESDLLNAAESGPAEPSTGDQARGGRALIWIGILAVVLIGSYAVFMRRSL
ncbi:MAG: hypothetical protein AAF633_18020 [Chloroflexota bacterium]